MPTVPAIPHLALQALLARYGLADASARRVAHLDMQVFQVRPTEGRPPLGLRVYGPGFQEAQAIQAELDWLQAAAQQGLHVPAPLPDLQGQLLQQVAWTPGAPAQFAVVLQWLPGRCLTRSLRPLHAQRVGEMLARLHGVAAGLQAQGRLDTSARAYLPDIGPWARGQRRRSPRLSRAAHDLACEAAAVLAHRMSLLQTTAPRFIHGDAHLWNLLFAGGQAGVIDFSGCGWGHFAQDLAAPLQYLKHPLPSLLDRRQAYPQLRARLLAGYASVSPLPDDIEQQVDTFIGLRCLGTLEWVLDDWPHPNHRSWGPQFLKDFPQWIRGYL